MASPPRKKLPFQKNSRSVPFPRPYIRAATISALFFLSVISLITVSVAFVILQTPESAYLVVATLVVTIIMWVISIFARRAARCLPREIAVPKRGCSHEMARPAFQGGCTAA